MSATCKKCLGKGMLPNSAYLDCASCDTAMIRVGLETWATENGIVANEEELWVIFKYGQSVALEEAAKACEETTVSTFGYWHDKHDDGEDTLANAAAAIRALK